MQINNFSFDTFSAKLGHNINQKQRHCCHMLQNFLLSSENTFSVEKVLKIIFTRTCKHLNMNLWQFWIRCHCQRSRLRREQRRNITRMRLCKRRKSHSRKRLRHVKSFALPRSFESRVSRGKFSKWTVNKRKIIVNDCHARFKHIFREKRIRSRWWNFPHKFSVRFWKIYWALWRMNAVRRRECQSPLLGRKEKKKRFSFVETRTWIEWVSWMFASAIEFQTMMFQLMRARPAQPWCFSMRPVRRSREHGARLNSNCLLPINPSRIAKW